MLCPYCNKEINSDSGFCPECGQFVSGNVSSDKSNEYWDDVNMASQKMNKKEKERVAKEISDIRKRRLKTFSQFALVAAVLCAIFLFVFIKKSNNEKALSAVHENMIGQTYSDTSKASFSPGESVSRIVLTIKDNSSLDYIRGEYRPYFEGNSLEWEEEEIYEEVTYDYVLNITFWGKMSIIIDGHEYEIELDEDGTIDYICLYDRYRY